MANVLIGSVLDLMQEELNGFLGKKEPRYLEHPPVLVSDLVDQKGDWAFSLGGENEVQQDRVIVTLINIEEETFGKAQLPYVKKNDHSIDLLNPEIKLNLYVLFSSFSNKSESERYLNCLNIISYVVLFFQSKHVFDHQNTPNLAQGIEKVIMELVSLTFEQQNYMWSTLGAKFMPSVLYKLRLLVVREIEDAIARTVIDEIRRDEVHIK